jgi:hypothetical protein
MAFRTWSLPALFPLATVVIFCLTGCPTRPHGPVSPTPISVPPGVPPAQPGTPEAPGHEPGTSTRIGHPYDVVSSESLLIILAFRGGALAKAGHNHVIASHDVRGTFYVPDDVLQSTFELHIPVGQLSIDEPQLRTQEGSDFPPQVPDSAKEGTRRNMLSEALLNGAQYPELILSSQRLQRGPMGTSVLADVQVTVRGQSHVIPVPVAYSLVGGELVALGELPIKQSDLGLTPFSAMLGALQVQDELRVRFRIVARQAQVQGQ